MLQILGKAVGRVVVQIEDLLAKLSDHAGKGIQAPFRRSPHHTLYWPGGTPWSSRQYPTQQLPRCFRSSEPLRCPLIQSMRSIVPGSVLAYSDPGHAACLARLHTLARSRRQFSRKVRGCRERCIGQNVTTPARELRRALCATLCSALRT